MVIKVNGKFFILCFSIFLGIFLGVFYYKYETKNNIVYKSNDIEVVKPVFDGKPMELSYKEFELLTYFLENQGIALSREKILNSVWNYDYFGDARTIDTHVKKLRSKMGEKGEYIKTIWGMGYKFEV